MTDITYWRERAAEYFRLADECETDYPALAVQYRALAAAYSVAVADKLVPIDVEKPAMRRRRRAEGTPE
jgi:hypothetical protein